MKHIKKNIIVACLIAGVLTSLSVYAAGLENILKMVVPFKEQKVTNGIMLNCGYECNMHTGKDIYAVDFDLSIKNSDEIIAIASGTVVAIHKTDEKKGYGTYILIRHIAENGEVYISRYAHLRINSVDHLSVGTRIDQGAVVGLAGNTGGVVPLPTNATPFIGDHLHFALYKEGPNGILTGVKPEPMYGDRMYETLAQGMRIKSGDSLLRLATVNPNSSLSVANYPQMLAPSGARFQAPLTVGVVPKLNETATFRVNNTANQNVLVNFIDVTDKESVQNVELNPPEAKTAEMGILTALMKTSAGSPSELAKGFVQLSLAMSGNSAAGASWETMFRKLLLESDLSLVKRLAGSLGQGISIENIATEFKGLVESLPIPASLKSAIQTNTINAQTEKQLASLGSSLGSKIETLVKTSGGVAIVLCIALALGIIGYMQKDKVKAEANLKNIMSAGAVAASVGKYWNLMPDETKKWLSGLRLQLQSAETIAKSVSGQISGLKQRKTTILKSSFISKKNQEELIKLSNGITLLERIEKNLLPAKISQNSYEEISSSALNTFFEKLSPLLFVPGKIAAKIEDAVQPRVLGTCTGAIRNPDGTITKYDSCQQITNDLESEKIRHWLRQYVVVGLNTGEFVAADGKKYQDLKKAWDITRTYLDSKKTPVVFHRAENEKFLSLNYMPERNPLRGYTGTYIPYPEKVAVASAGISDTRITTSKQAEAENAAWQFETGAKRQAELYGMKVAYADYNRVWVYFQPNSDYPIGMDTKELRTEAEKWVNRIIEEVDDPYTIIHPRWSSTIVTPCSASGSVIAGGNGSADYIDNTKNQLLFQKLIDEATGVTRKKEKYFMPDTCRVYNEKSMNNLGVRIIEPLELAPSLEACRTGARGGAEGKIDAELFRKAITNIEIDRGLFRMKNLGIQSRTYTNINEILAENLKIERALYEQKLQEEKLSKAVKQLQRDTEILRSVRQSFDNILRNSQKGMMFEIGGYGYLYDNYIFKTKEDVAKYKFWMQYGGMGNVELKNLLKTVRPSSDLIKEIPCSASFQTIDARTTKQDWKKIEQNELQRKKELAQSENFIKNITQEKTPKEMIPAEIANIPDYAELMTKLRQVNGQFVVNNQWINGGLKEALKKQMEYETIMLRQKLNEKIESELGKGNVITLIQNGKNIFLSSDGVAYEKMEDALNASYLLKMRGIREVKTWPTLQSMSYQDLKSSLLQKPVAGKLSGELAGMKVTYEMVSGITIHRRDYYGNPLKTCIDMNGKEQPSLKDALFANKKEIERRNKIWQEIANGTLGSAKIALRYNPITSTGRKNFILDLEQKINNALQNYCIVSDPAGNGYYAPDGRIYSSEQAKAIAKRYRENNLTPTSIQLMPEYMRNKTWDQWDEHWASTHFNTLVTLEIGQVTKTPSERTYRCIEDIIYALKKSEIYEGSDTEANILATAYLKNALKEPVSTVIRNAIAFTKKMEFC